MSTYEYEYTDTFGGEANYCWVERGEIKAPDIKTAMRRARKELGLAGRKGKADFWDCLSARWSPSGCCTVLFVNFKEGKSNE